MRAPGRKSRSKSLEGGEDRKTSELDHAHKTAGRLLYSQARARLFFVEQQVCDVWVDPRPVGPGVEIFAPVCAGLYGIQRLSPRDHPLLCDPHRSEGHRYKERTVKSQLEVTN